MLREQKWQIMWQQMWLCCKTCGVIFNKRKALQRQRTWIGIHAKQYWTFLLKRMSCCQAIVDAGGPLSERTEDGKKLYRGGLSGNQLLLYPIWLILLISLNGSISAGSAFWTLTSIQFAVGWSMAIPNSGECTKWAVCPWLSASWWGSPVRWSWCWALKPWWKLSGPSAAEKWWWWGIIACSTSSI